MKIRLKLKQRQVEGDQSAIGWNHAIYDLCKPRTPAIVRGLPDATIDATIDRVFGRTPNYNALADHTEAVRRQRLGYPVDDVDNVVEDDDVDERPVPPTNRRRMLFPDAPGLRPLSWNDVED